MVSGDTTRSTVGLTKTHSVMLENGISMIDGTGTSTIPHFTKRSALERPSYDLFGTY